MSDILNELLTDIMILGEATEASKEAKAKKLVYLGFGNYGPAKGQPATYTTDKVTGKLVAVAQKQAATVKPQVQKPTKPTSTGERQPTTTVGEPEAGPRILTKAPKIANRDMAALSKIEQYATSQPEEVQTRIKLLSDLWKAFLNAPSDEERIKAVTAMAEYNLIEAHSGGKKIYLNSNTGLHYKAMSGQAGTAVTKLMNTIIKKYGITVPVRGSAKDRAMADASGKHNEAGVVAHVFPSEENKSAYSAISQTYGELGGSLKEADAANKKAADIIKSTLPAGAKITDCKQVGGIGATALKQMGIDPKTDPTDIVVKYTVDGKEKLMKLSAKVYTNPKNITMKNSGVSNAGADYLGEPEGSVVDKKWPKIKKQYQWTPDMSEEEKATRKAGMKQAYLQSFAGEMEKLTNTPEGQERLLNMWKNVHGCGKDVYTLVTNKTTGGVDIKAPSYYCEPTQPFKVKYDGIKVVIEMNTGGPQFLQIDMKTEDVGSPRLLFRHRVR